MRFLALIIQLPLFAVFAWIYLVFPRDRVRTARSWQFDIAAIVLALVASLFAMLITYSADYSNAGPIWQQVASALAAFHTFSFVLAFAWWLRGRLLHNS
jgi:uncharacterized BrkB/YihY/UPF0761 family membrane protein